MLSFIKTMEYNFYLFLKIIVFSIVFTVILAFFDINPAKVLLDAFSYNFETISNVFKYFKFENLSLALKLVFLFAGVPLAFLIICCVLYFKDNENE